MATNAARAIAVNLTGDVILDKIFSATANASSPGSTTIHALSSGNNTISVPTVTGFTVKAATIIPPAGNTVALILKGVAGDTGITISNTDPTSIAFETAPASFVLNAASALNGVRIVWT